MYLRAELRWLLRRLVGDWLENRTKSSQHPALTCFHNIFMLQPFWRPIFIECFDSVPVAAAATPAAGRQHALLRLPKRRAW